MRNLKLNLFFLCCAAVSVAIFCPGCGSDEPQESGADNGEPNAAVDPAADAVAATVNGVNILESEIQMLIKPQLDSLAEKTKYMPAEDVEDYTRQFRQLALEQLIRRELLDEKIKQADITISDEAVMAQIEQIASAQGMSVEQFSETMKQYGHTLEGIKKDIREGLARNQFMSSQWEGKITVTEDEAKKYYEENPRDFDVPEQVRVSHILIKPEAGGDPNEAKATAKAKAEDLLVQIKAGADFAELAKANSACPSAPKGGDLNFFPRGKTTPPFEKVAFELKVGQISDVVETEYGFHIIKATDRIDSTKITFEQARDKIIEALTESRQSEFANEYLNGLKAEATIVYPAKS